MSTEAEERKAFDLFELLTAILLGLGAIGAAVAGMQGGQWGGKQLEAFSEANTLTTKAATQYNEDIVGVNADYATVAQAKHDILEARDAKTPEDRERHFELASYMYANQLTETAYRAMKLPMDYYVEDEQPGEKKAESEAPAAEGASETPASEAPAEGAAEAPAAPEDPNKPRLERDIPDEALLASLHVELDEAYVDKALEKGAKLFQDADKRFEDGRKANEIGDKFDLVGVIYTVALFFGGIGLIFKTEVRWGFFVLGLLVFLAASGTMARLPWAS
jgi:hypothetical protein